MIEIVFNAVWLAVAVAAFVFVPRRSGKALLALAAILVLLFPIISVSDDLALDRNSLEEALAIIVAFLTLFVGLVAFARVEPRLLQPALVLLATPSDPRSPPRA
ncbi:MAG TPA: hypothetical protein VNN25_27565 [Thermoanaerobaculia bacterium]|nr:hypothetical protein [Thermoanaerobaculia bacterium]